MLKLLCRNAHLICWIVIGSFVQAQEFSTTVVKEGEDAIIECGLQTTVTDGYLKWEAITNSFTEVLAIDLRNGYTDCNDRIINCTLYANGSIQLESVGKEDAARYYHCLRGDDNGYNYYSDHRLLVLSKGSFVQAQEFSTTVVKEEEDAIIECGVQTTVADGYLKWEAITNDTTELLAIDLGDGHTDCNDRIINCTIHANGSIQLESVSKEDAARYYRCLRGDEHGYNYYSDHRLLVLSKEKTSSPPSIETPHRESVSSYNMGKKGVLHGYNAPVCEDDVDGNLPVVCYPPSGILVDREYETIQCNCTDSDGLMDSVIFPVTRQMSSPPSIETPHRESVSSYNMGKKGVLHGYNAPVCEDDVDGNLPVVCYPPSGIIVDREYETIQCNCTNSDGLMDSLNIPVTSITHWVHPGWWMASISLLVFILISIIVVLIWICLNPCKNLKKSETNRGHEASSQESGVPDSTNNTQQNNHSANNIVAVQPSDQTITEASLRSNEEKDKQGHSSSDYTGCHADLLKRKDDEKRVETSFKGPTNTYTSHDNPDYDGDSDYEEEDPLLNSKVQEVVLAKLPAGDTKETTQVARTVSLWDAKTVKPHADNGPKRPCKEYRIDESDGERSFYFEFDIKKPGAHLVLSTSREENSPSTYEICFDEGKIRTTTEGREGDSVPYDCGRFSMIMREEELSLFILDEDEGWIPLLKWEKQVYLNQCCFIAVFNIKFLNVETCRRLTAFESPTSRTLSLHPKRE